MQISAFKQHDHGLCIATGISALQDYCNEKGLQYTILRRRVYEILIAEHKAVGAYDILDKLRAQGMSDQPPVAYRNLDFLVRNGFAHKIEKLSAFIACAHIGKTHNPAFLICRECKSISETIADSSLKPLRMRAKDVNFSIESSVVEAIGICPSCRYRQ